MAILAEACTNWVDISGARDLIRVSHDCGAALTKFQLFSAESDRGTPHYAWVKAHELTFEQAKELFAYGDSIGQEVFFSVFGAQYVAWCERIGVKRYKLAAGWRDKATWEAIAATGKPCFVSRNEDETYHWPALMPDISTMWCPSGYPQKELQLESSPRHFSDHTIGIDVAKVAIARGAQVVEKHFCLEHNRDFPDDSWSMTPDELTELVRWERAVQECL